MKLLAYDVKAVIFDMDGTLLDSTSLWHDIDTAFFAKRGMKVPEEYAQHIVHLGLQQAAIYTKRAYGFEETPEEIMDEWHQMSLDIYKNDVKMKPGAMELLELLKNRGIKMAIATANDEKLYMPCIERLGIKDYFDFIADVNNVKEGKQSAKIYEFLAEQMGSPKDCTVVIEDMPTCVKTAYQNGFITIAINDPASKNYNEDKSANSDLFIDSFFDLIDLLK